MRSTALRVTAQRFAKDRSASTAIEYALMTFIAVAVIVAITSLGGTVNDMYEQVVKAFTN